MTRRVRYVNRNKGGFAALLARGGRKTSPAEERGEKRRKAGSNCMTLVSLPLHSTDSTEDKRAAAGSWAVVKSVQQTSISAATASPIDGESADGVRVGARGSLGH